MKYGLTAVVFVAAALTLSAQSPRGAQSGHGRGRSAPSKAQRASYMPRSEWHAMVEKCALDPVVLKATIVQLSSEDKKAFLAEVNEAISKMPGSPEAKAAQFLAINRAAVAGAGPADRLAVLAEVFATVPTESLAVVNEEFAKNEFARPETMSKEQYAKIISTAMGKIVERCSSSESGAVRSGFAGIMFVRAAGDAADAAQSAVVSTLPPEVRLDARNKWIPAALGKEQTKSYDSMLGAAQAGEEPDHQLTVSMYSQQMIESMLSDLQTTHESGEEIGKIERGTTPVDFFNAGADAMGVKEPTPPRGMIADKEISGALITGRPEDNEKPPVKNPWYGGDGRGDSEPGPYWLQHL